MDTLKFPAVRLPIVNNGECVTPDGVVLELPTSNKFSVAWPSDSRSSLISPTSDRQNLSSSENESETSDGNSGDEPTHSMEQITTPPIRAMPQVPETSRSSKIPRFSRALSMPLTSQLGYLRHPHRPEYTHTRTQRPKPSTPPDLNRLRELSVELADSVQMMIQTMLQVSPPQLLDPAKEQFSACSLSVPTSSMSAMLTTMKNLNYISANMSDFCTEAPRDILDMGPPPPLGLSPNHADFDIGEMLQSIGDLLSGTAAQLGVDLVLYHGDDIGLRHVCVRGDESSISYALSHVVRQVLATAQHGDSIELGLLVGCLDPKSGEARSSPDDEYPTSGEPLPCTVRISHKFATNIFTPGSAQSRPQPAFSSLLLRRLLHQIRASLVPDLPPPKQFVGGRTCDFTLMLERGALSVTNTPLVSDPHDEEVDREPTVDQLTMFAEGLRGKRVVLYASAKGSFAQHLTSYLTAWGMDVTHVSPDGGVDGLVEPTSTLSTDAADPTPISKPDNTASNTLANSHQPLSFLFIDDDVDVLKERLSVIRAEQPNLNFNVRKRPSLVPHHRPRSSPQIVRTMGQAYHSLPPSSSVAVVHFTSLSNYKIVKDVIQSVMLSHAGSSTPLPEVMIIPKPAGPRRFLTALHTAVTKPAVDPFFAPIATSPTSPGLHPAGSFFHSYNNSETNTRSSTKTHRPSGSRSSSDRSMKSTKDNIDHAPHPPPSPLGMSDNVEYFSEAAAKLGASPSSGLVIQSPDGQPAGIFFHPRSKTSRNPSSQSMERDKGHLHVPSGRGKSPSRLSANPEPPVTFSSLHAVATPLKPNEDSWAASARAAARKPSSPHAEEHSPPRRPSPTEAPRRTMPQNSPPTETPPNRRATPRRTTQEGGNTASASLAAESKRVKAAADSNIVPPISVLIVDDNPINQTILSTFMKKKKIKYDLANNGQEAVQKWRTGGFHLILMDIQMPVMDGIQATKEIRRLEHTNAAAGYPPTTPSLEERFSSQRTPSDSSSTSTSTSSPYRSSVIIVALTASSLQSDRVAALAAGCNDFLTKPVSLIWLNSKIIEWGSIKALQMWADVRPDAMGNLSTGQAAQTRGVAERLHVPKGRATPSLNRKTIMENHPRLPSAAGSTTSIPGLTSPTPNNVMMPSPSTSSMFWNPDRTWNTTDDVLTPPPSGKTLNELAKDLAQGGRRGTSSLHTSNPALISTNQDSGSQSDVKAVSSREDKQSDIPAGRNTVNPSAQ